MRNLIKRLIPDRLLVPMRAVRNALFDVHCAKTYSQEGEDMVLRRIFAGKAQGFYVDVGAHHPQRFSNTYWFYQRGWRGINIEPNPDVIAQFGSVRARDINLQVGVSDSAGNLTYYRFDEPALNTFDSEIVQSRQSKTHYKLISSCEIAVERLDRLLAAHLPENTKIDFLTIDVEGLDFAVLRSNDWERYRPECVLVEALDSSLEDVMRGEIFHFMKDHQYVLFAKTHNTLFFLNKRTGDLEESRD